MAVAIAGILASLLIPAAGRWMDRARVSQCVGNLRSIGQAAFSYAAENDGRFPSAVAPEVDAETAAVAGRDNNDRLLMALHPYTRSAKVFRCAEVCAAPGEETFRNGRYNSTYNQNVYTFAAKAAALPSASDMILVYEGYPFLSYSGTPPNHRVETYSPISSVVVSHPSDTPSVKSMNALMADGHVRTGLRYFGWGDPKNTIPQDGGIWGFERYSFNQP